MRLFAIVFAFVLPLGACEDRQALEESRAAIAETEAHWRELSDGSHFTRTAFGSDGSRNEGAIRCWRAEHGGYACLLVVDARTGGFDFTSVDIRSEAELPHTIIPLGGSSDGYSCSYTIGYTENIRRNGELLISNDVRFGNRAWSPAFVADYMASNRVDGQRHYRCLDILQAVRTGSLETVSTTSVNRSMLD